jgi:hypothetical protein
MCMNVTWLLSFALIKHFVVVDYVAVANTS